MEPVILKAIGYAILLFAWFAGMALLAWAAYKITSSRKNKDE